MFVTFSYRKTSYISLSLYLRVFSNLCILLHVVFFVENVILARATANQDSSRSSWKHMQLMNKIRMLRLHAR